MMMMIRSGVMGLAIVALSGAASVASAQSYFNGFETDTAGYLAGNFAAVRVASGTNGIPSATGGWHATGVTPATNWGGYTTTFPGDGFITSIDVYLNTSGGLPNDARLEFSSAVSGTTNVHRRDYVFNMGFYNDLPGPGVGNRFVISAGNNTQGWPKNPDRNPIAIETTGWYTLRHTFTRSAGDVLSVELAVLDSQGTTLGTWTLSNPTDIIGTTVGGNRYGWFATNQWGASLAFDNATKRGLYYVVDTRDQDLILDLDLAVENAHNATVVLPSGNPYVSLGKTAEANAYAAHNAAAALTYFDETDFPAALASYKQLRYQQVTYHGRAAQYLNFGGSPANGLPKTYSLTAKNLGNVDFNAP